MNRLEAAEALRREVAAAEDAREDAALQAEAAGKVVDQALAEINAAYDAGDKHALLQLQTRYRRWTRQSVMPSVWVIPAEYARAACDCIRWGADLPCTDCGEVFRESAINILDSNHICRECGDARDFRHGQGKYYDAFA